MPNLVLSDDEHANPEPQQAAPADAITPKAKLAKKQRGGKAKGDKARERHKRHEGVERDEDRVERHEGVESDEDRASHDAMNAMKANNGVT